ncbi:MAG: anti-sigma F factor [Ruminococcus sp.]|jgi:stage II sporulation protein AB (anti-sigma F factor)|nr:anti-sigma F factor [Ruminococcus sp.]
MKLINEMKLSFISQSSNEAFARSAICAFVASADPSVGDLSDIRTAVSEAVTNCVVHAYRERAGIIEINARIDNRREVYIRIKDKGCGIPDVGQAMEPMWTSMPNEERSGLGFSVMESFCDSISVKSKVGIGTTVILRKLLQR